MLDFKNDMVAFLDRGIFGTLLKEDTIGTENGYVNIYYYPLQKHGWFKGKPRVIRNIPLDTIHKVNNPTNDDGAIKSLVYIYTDEPDSIVKRIFNSSLQRKIEEYKETIKSLQKQVTASKQESSDARAGVSKTIDTMKKIAKGTTPRLNDIIPPRRPYDYTQRPFANEFANED